MSKDKSDEEKALTIICPFCGEPVGYPCRTRSFERKSGPHKVKTHVRRILKAKGEGL